MGRKGELTDKTGKRIRKGTIGLANIEVHVPNVNTFKSVQIRISGWVAPVLDASQDDYDRVISLTKFRLKKMIREWSDEYKFYRPESIIDIKTGDVNRYTKTHQYLKVDIVLFVRPELSYDKYFALTTSDDIIERSIVILDDFPDYWFFIKKGKMNKVDE